MLTLAQLDSKKFRKNLSNFNLKKIVQEVIKIQEEKLIANNITILTEFQGFLNNQLVCTDEFRVQQVLLNL
jgi:signal transduction histidine kinase